MARDTSPQQIPLAIIGMGCRVPGADGLDEFWSLLVEGRSSVGELPPDRLDRELNYDPQPGVRNKSYTCVGGVLSPAADDFSATPLSPRLERRADITHRRLCQVAADAFRHAGFDPFNLPLRNVGVYVGHTVNSDEGREAQHALTPDDVAACLDGVAELTPADQAALCRQLAEKFNATRPQVSSEAREASAHMAAGIVSKAFGLSGPFMAVNAACASSLEALVLAARSLQLGEIDAAVVGGSSVCSHDWLVLFSQARSLSDSGSRPFDERADGLVVAEASVAIIVKTLHRAIADGDHIQAVIRGIGLSSDGRGRSLWAPRSEGQVAAIRRAYQPGVELSEVQYIEAHATATQLGDATEISSLRQVFEGTVLPGKKIPIASVKANLGHTLEAAGLVGVVKTVLSMQRGLIPKAVNVQSLNPKVDWASVPFVVPLESMPWPEPPPGKPRRAGVNAFGIGGLNVHVVLDSFLGQGAKSPAPPVPTRTVDDRAVAVIGLGCVFPGATNTEALSKLLQAGHAPKQVSSLARRVEGFQYDWHTHRIAPREIELADPLQFMLLDAADQALRSAGYDQKDFDRRQTAVVVGSEFGGDFNHRLHLSLRLPRVRKLLKEMLLERKVSPHRADDVVAAFDDAWHAIWPVLLDNSGSYSASSLAVRIAKTWDLMGGAVALDSGSTSGLAALHTAMDLLTSGDCSLVICGAAQRDLQNVIEYSGQASATSNGFSRTGVPFGRDGTAAGAEGAGVVLLKRLSDAQRDGDPIHAVLRGVSSVHDNSSRAARLALESSLLAAGANPRDLALVMCDACGDSERDEVLLKAVAASQIAANRKLPLPLRSMVGHLGNAGGAAGIASLVATVLALKTNRVPAACEARALIAAAQHVQTIVQCQGAAGSLAGSSSQPVKSAVLSHGEGLAYCVVVEQAASVEASATAGTAEPESSPATDAQIFAAVESRLFDLTAIAAALVEHVVELTGYPPEVLDLDADLLNDLSIRAEEVQGVVAQVQRGLAVERPQALPSTCRTLRQVAEFLEQPRVRRSTDAKLVVSRNGHAQVLANGHVAKPTAQTVAHRSILEAVEKPWPTGTSSRFEAQGAVLILGSNAVAGLLRHKIEQGGATVYTLAPENGHEEVLRTIDELPANPPVRHVFLLTSLDVQGAQLLDSQGWPTRRLQGIELPVLVLQKWKQRLAKDQANGPFSIVAATMLGGDLGVAEPVAAPEGGWIAGLLKSINVELARQQQPALVKVCDFSPHDQPDDIVENLLRELTSQQTEVEVALGGGRRRVLRSVRQSAERLPSSLLERGSTWVITGGARGITAEVALTLGREYGLNLHLIGRSPVPRPDAPWRNASTDELKAIKRGIVRQAIAEGKSPEKQWDRVKYDIEIEKNLVRMRSLGLQAHYHACDVSDWTALGKVLNQARRLTGPIVGIIHGAGYARTSRLETLKRDDLKATIDAKVAGALGLMHHTRHDPLRYFVGFGSISGRFGGNGLSDYAAANDMLARLCAWFRGLRPDCATCCIDWQSWDEVGMAMLPDSTVGTRGVLKMKFIPPAEGVEHLRRELCAGLPEREVLIDDGEFEQLMWAAI